MPQMDILAKTQELNFLPSSTQVSIGQLLTTFADNFGFRCLECHLVGKEFHVSSCNIFRGTTAFWQGQHNVESWSSSGIATLLLAFRIPKGFRDAASHRPSFHPCFPWVQEEPARRGARKILLLNPSCRTSIYTDECCTRESSNWNFRQDSRIKFLVIFNSRDYRPTTYYFCQQLKILKSGMPSCW